MVYNRTMTLTYQDALDLKEAGFPQEGNGTMRRYHSGLGAELSEGFKVTPNGVEIVDLYLPTLEELIEACGDRFLDLLKAPTEYISLKENKWVARADEDNKGFGSSPIQAVKSLYIVLHKNVSPIANK